MSEKDKTPPPTEQRVIIDRKVLSKQGAAVEVVMLTLSNDANKALSADVPKLGKVREE